MRPLTRLALLSLVLGVVACGSDGGPPGLTALTITGVPAESMVPGQSAQLKAVGTYGDGTTADLTATATWTSTAPAVLSVSTGGLVTAVSPGDALVVVAAPGASNSAAVRVAAAPTWATLATGGSVYRINYELDAQRRIGSYEALDQAAGRRVLGCTGDLHGAWECRDETSGPRRTYLATVDAQGRPITYGYSSSDVPQGEDVTYAYDAAGRLVAVARTQWTPAGDQVTRISTLSYDSTGRLSAIGLRVNSLKNPFMRTDQTYTVQSAGENPTRLLLTRKDYLYGFPLRPDYAITLTYDAGRRLTEKVVSEVTDAGDRIASRLGFEIDSRGFLVNQIREQYQYEPAGTNVIRTESPYCVDWTATTPPAVAREAACPGGAIASSIAYPFGRMPSAPLTVFPAYTASSGLDLLCAIAEECVDPARVYPRPF